MSQKKLRQMTLLEQLSTERDLNIKKTAERFEVSRVTIKKDLDELSELFPEVNRSWGKAFWAEPLLSKVFRKEVKKNHKAKRKAADIARDNIKQGDFTAIMAGTIPFLVSRTLSGKDTWKVATNNIPVLVALSQEAKIKTACLGNHLNSELFLSLTQTEETNLESIRRTVRSIGVEANQKHEVIFDTVVCEAKIAYSQRELNSKNLFFKEMPGEQKIREIVFSLSKKIVVCSNELKRGIPSVRCKKANDYFPRDAKQITLAIGERLTETQFKHMEDILKDKERIGLDFRK